MYTPKNPEGFVAGATSIMQNITMKLLIMSIIINSSFYRWLVWLWNTQDIR